VARATTFVVFAVRDFAKFVGFYQVRISVFEKNIGFCQVAVSVRPAAGSAFRGWVCAASPVRYGAMLLDRIEVAPG